MVRGLAKNPGFVAAIEKEANIKKVQIPDNPEFAYCRRSGLDGR